MQFHRQSIHGIDDIAALEAGSREENASK